MLPLLSLTIFITAASGIPDNSAHVSTNDPSGLPVMGDIWGAAITHVGEMKYTQIRYQHRYYYPSQGKEDVLVDYVLASVIFWNKRDMYRHIKSVVTDDSVVIQLDPAALEGKYLEVLSSKVISADAIKMTCHSYKTMPAFCHNLADTNHKFKLMYSMVRDIDNGNLFSTVFVSHQGCTRDNDQLKCYWVTHVNEIIVLDKSCLSCKSCILQFTGHKL